MKLYLDYGNERRGGAEALFRAACADYCAGVTQGQGQGQKGQNGDGSILSPGATCTDAEKADFEVARGPHGKPYFAAPPLRGKVFFSISHSGGRWAVLFHDSEVGFDLEDMGKGRGLTKERMERIAARFFTDDEAAYLLDGVAADGGGCVAGVPEILYFDAEGRPRGSCAPQPAYAGPRDYDFQGSFREKFFRLWTAKESYIKYTGLGLSDDLRSFSVLSPPEGVVFATFSPAPGLICSYCAPTCITA